MPLWKTSRSECADKQVQTTALCRLPRQTIFKIKHTGTLFCACIIFIRYTRFTKSKSYKSVSFIIYLGGTNNRQKKQQQLFSCTRLFVCFVFTKTTTYNSFSDFKLRINKIYFYPLTESIIESPCWLHQSPMTHYQYQLVQCFVA